MKPAQQLTKDTALRIFENGYIDQPTMRGELKDYGCAVLDLIRRRLQETGSIGIIGNTLIEEFKQELQETY